MAASHRRGANVATDAGSAGVDAALCSRCSKGTAQAPQATPKDTVSGLPLHASIRKPLTSSSSHGQRVATKLALGSRRDRLPAVANLRHPAFEDRFFQQQGRAS